LPLAFVFGWRPFEGHQASCPAGQSAYMVFVDNTASNSDRSNWYQQADQFVGGLKPCDCVRFGIIDDRTSQNEEYGEAIQIPLVDPNAGYPDRENQQDAYEAALTRVRDTLRQLIAKTSDARVTDILGAFNRLEHVAPPPISNILVIFSDGLESAAGAQSNNAGIDVNFAGAGRINLEKNCLVGEMRQRLITAAQNSPDPSGNLGKFSEIIWVVPNKTGKYGCNSLPELRLFWAGVIRARSRDGRAPHLRFETNPF